MRALELKKALCLSLFLACSIPAGHAAAIKENNNLKMLEKTTSPIAKALDQQKRNTSLSLSATDDELKMLNTIRTTPTQTFFASQHERFSRFVQTIFQPHSS
ncbi:DUF4179 domain-containing protein [Acinetobacter sp. NIPH 2699]|uniref:DUF4179 domain-containing protein n=1 Tax=Acinetobacter sp. NIPH 2699 TaxID=2923433 RepID=UPI001F4A2678|nr:DUF4179 domain-containing protein [Acinetobacter sp. NIPH 2699]MCH7335811.1 DUF4179 domain-containing protein [Acinetobacter sp. NIPH 2699]